MKGQSSRPLPKEHRQRKILWKLEFKDGSKLKQRIYIEDISRVYVSGTTQQGRKMLIPNGSIKTIKQVVE